MSDHIVPFGPSRFLSSPVVQQALAIVARTERRARVRGSRHLASRVYYPLHIVAVEEGSFFPTSEPPVTETHTRQAPEITLRRLQDIFSDECFL